MSKALLSHYAILCTLIPFAFAGNSLLRIVIIDIVINTLLGRVTRRPAGMHCPSWDDAFVSSLFCFLFFFVTLRVRSAVRSRGA